MASLGSSLFGARRLPASARWSLTLVRAASATVFISFGVGKFVNHASESASFQTYGLPAPEAFTLVIGLLELLGGVFLLAGLATRATSLLLAGDMVGAIVVSGLLHGETVSLTLAPALLIAMIALSVYGPGAAAVDARLHRGRSSPSRPAAP